MFKDNIILKGILLRVCNVSRLIHATTTVPIPIGTATTVDGDRGGVTQLSKLKLNTIDTFINSLIQKNYNMHEKLGHDLKRQHTCKVESLEAVNASANFIRCVDLLSKSFSTDFQALQCGYELNLNIATLHTTQLDNLLESTIEMRNTKDFQYIIEKCIQGERLPSSPVLLASLKYLSVMGKVDLIESITRICEGQQHPLLETYVELAPFKALALWRSGNACLSSLSTLYDSYVKNYHSNNGKCLTRSIFDVIINECLKKSSDALLQKLIQIAKTLHKEHSDIFVMACLWKQSFSSDWFTDQQLASELFESSSDLRQLVTERSKQLCNILLAKHKLNAVQRLIEIFIKYEQQEATSNCLSLLFNYQYLHRDVRACTEIVKSCNTLNIELNQHQVKQFLDLILNKNCNTVDFQRKLHCKKKNNVNVNQIQYRF